MTLDEVPIAEVWTLLGGPKLRVSCGGNARGIAFWRPKADGWNVAVNGRKNCWFDHRDGLGGGVLKLVQTARGLSEHEALEWLEAYAGLTPSHPLSLEDRRRYAQAREHAPELARAAMLWHVERLGELDHLKREALECEDMPALMAAAQDDHLLTILAPEGVVRAYIDARRKWPEHTAALVAYGARWAAASQAAVAALIVQWHDDAAEIERWETDGGATA
jgi:hypothetical protein